MAKRLWGFVFLIVLLVAGCAKPPTAALEAARRQIARADAIGAAEYAPEPYRLAGNVLLQAEELVQQHKYAEAEQLLGQVRDCVNEALTLTGQRKLQQQQEELERQRLAAEAQARAAEEAAQRALLEQRRQQELARQQALKEAATKPVVKKEPPKPKLVTQVTVGPAENLLMLAARPEVYNDGQLWPLIYKANRDQIKDPKQISPGQILLVPRDKTPEEIEAARREALELNLF